MLKKNDVKAFKNHHVSQMRQSLLRVKQATGERVIGTDKTSFESNLGSKLQKLDATEKNTKKIVDYSIKLIEAGQENEILSGVKSHLNNSKVKPNKHETFGNCLLDASNDFLFSDYGKNLRTLGEAQKQLAQYEREYVNESKKVFVEPLKSFLTGELALIQQETKLLDKKRLDLDVSKNKLSKLKNDDLRTDIEAEVKNASRHFEHQSNIVSESIDALQNTYIKQSEYLRLFIEAQANYHSKCADILRNLANQMDHPD